jgi:mono/diheme cytochrome c family protein
MKEIKYILHAFLLLFAFISVFICVKEFYSTQKQVPEMDLTDQQKIESTAFLKGKQLFLSKCAVCHILFSNSTGPALCGFESRGPWSERENVNQWIKNPVEFMKKDHYTRELKESFGGVVMTAFPELTNTDIDEIISYINNACGPTMAKR